MYRLSFASCLVVVLHTLVILAAIFSTHITPPVRRIQNQELFIDHRLHPYLSEQLVHAKWVRRQVRAITAGEGSNRLITLAFVQT